MTSRRNRRRSQTTRGVPSGAALFVIPGMVLAMALAGCAGRPAGPPAGPGQPAGAAAIVASMTLPEKVGQLLVPTVPGQQLANRSITVAADEPGSGSGGTDTDRLLPLRSKRVYVAGPAAAGLATALQPDLAATGGRIVASAADAQVIVAATQDAAGDAAQQKLVRGLVATGRPVVVLATGLPYDLGLFGGIRAAVASYSASSVSLSAAAGVLTGRLRPAGRLPVDIPAAGGTAFRYGTGLRY